MRLKELAKDLEKQNAANKKGKQTKILEENKRVLSESEKLDEMYVCIPFFVIFFFAWRTTFVDCFDMSWFRLAASIAAEEGGSLDNNASTSAAAAVEDMDSDGDGDEEMILVKKWTGKKKKFSLDFVATSAIVSVHFFISLVLQVQTLEFVLIITMEHSSLRSEDSALKASSHAAILH